jgi:hypothetical protein
MLKQKAIQSFARQHFNEIKYIEESNGPASFWMLFERCSKNAFVQRCREKGIEKKFGL